MQMRLKGSLLLALASSSSYWNFTVFKSSSSLSKMSSLGYMTRSTLVKEGAQEEAKFLGGKAKGAPVFFSLWKDCNKVFKAFSCKVLGWASNSEIFWFEKKLLKLSTPKIEQIW